MITFIPAILRRLIGGLASVRGFLRNLWEAIIEVEEDRVKLEAEVFQRYNRITTQTENDHAGSHKGDSIELLTLAPLGPIE